MLKIEETYKEKLTEFNELSNHLTSMICAAFPPADKANLNDLAGIRGVCIKMKEAASIADGYFGVRKLQAGRNKAMNP